MRSNFMLAILLRLKTEWSFKLVRILLCMVAHSRNMLHSYEIGPIIRCFFYRLSTNRMQRRQDHAKLTRGRISGVSRGVFWLPGNPPPPAMIFF